MGLGRVGDVASVVVEENEVDTVVMVPVGAVGKR